MSDDATADPHRSAGEDCIAMAALTVRVADVNLSMLVADLATLDPDFAVTSVTGGTATILSDGTTAQFTPAAECNPNAGFQYTVSVGGTVVAERTVNLSISPYHGITIRDGILRIGGTSGVDIITSGGGVLSVNGAIVSTAGVSEIRVWGREL